ncbi:transcription factor TFIIIB subunit brf1 [Chytriomyces hyalinus]|nr:transcription factor TFIIIB subunit brf1 [Chytriomyces hyalinus]
MPTCRCGSSAVETDNALGHLVCQSCGEVLEQNAIVSEVTFTEGGGGQASADGFFISKNSARASSKGGPGGVGRLGAANGTVPESREQTIANGHRRIAQIGHQMRMSGRQIEQAQRYFNLAIVQNFTKGRKSNSVAAACLYIICRIEKTSHMLIDFSEHLRMNLYSLGTTFVRLVHTLNIKDIPLVDPMLYIVRFASRLEFEDKAPNVIKDATKLVSRLDRDWIVRGRKPAGICAACLYIAARMNGFTRSVTEIVEIVKICESTLRHRLAEFKQTPSSALSVDDFQNLMLESSQDPPSFLRKKRNLEEEDKAIGEGGLTAVQLAARAAGIKRNEDGDIKGKRSSGRGGYNEYDAEEVDVDPEAEAAADEMQEALKTEEFREIAKIAGINMDAYDEDLSFLDDDLEVNGCLLTEEEVDIKKLFWEAENKDWERAKLATDAANANKPVSKKPRKKREPSSGGSGPAGSAHEAGLNFIASKPSLSKKINYDMIDSLFNEDPSATDGAGYNSVRTGNYATGSVTGFGLVGYGN